MKWLRHRRFDMSYEVQRGMLGRSPKLAISSERYASLMTQKKSPMSIAIMKMHSQVGNGSGCTIRPCRRSLRRRRRHTTRVGGGGGGGSTVVLFLDNNLGS